MEFARKTLSVCIATTLATAVVAVVAWASLNSLNQIGGAGCPAKLWIYGSSVVSGDTIPSCQVQFTNGSVLFAGTVSGASGGVTQDNAKIFWDDTNFRLGIGTSTPGTTLDVNGDITDRNVTSCGTGKALRTDGTGKLICQSLSCSVGAQSCSCSCTDSTNHACIACSCTVGAASCTVN